MSRSLGRLALVALVIVLGLLQGTRTALGRVPLARAPVGAEIATSPARQLDWRRGHFFRPVGSNAVRPRLRLRPRVWEPE